MTRSAASTACSSSKLLDVMVLTAPFGTTAPIACNTRCPEMPGGIYPQLSVRLNNRLAGRLGCLTFRSVRPIRAAPRHAS